MCDNPLSKTTPADITAAGLITLSDDETSYIPQVPGLVLNTSTFNQVAKYAATKE